VAVFELFVMIECQVGAKSDSMAVVVGLSLLSCRCRAVVVRQKQKLLEKKLCFGPSKRTV
jgi:hypothetical protein